MKHILIINSHQPYPFAKGLLTDTLISEIEEILSPFYKIKKTIIKNGYDIKEEQEKFFWADTIIFQFPIYWFSEPAILKEYMQNVYEYDVFYSFSGSGYGQGGLLKGRDFMLSTTWNSPLEAFGKGFWKDVKTPSEVLIPFRQTQKFIGLGELKHFSCHDVIKNPRIETFLNNLENHLKEVFSLTGVSR